MTDYSEEFNQLWQLFGMCQKYELGRRGSKPRAFKEFEKLGDEKTPAEWANHIGTIAAHQMIDKIKEKRTSGWTEPFQHLERYLRNQRWLDDEGIDQLPDIIEGESDQERVAQRKRELMSRDWAK